MHVGWLLRTCEVHDGVVTWATIVCWDCEQALVRNSSLMWSQPPPHPLPWSPQWEEWETGARNPRETLKCFQKTRERYKRIRMNLRECVSFSYYFILIIILDTQVQCLRGNRREFEEIYIGISSSTKHTTSYNNSYLRLFNQKVYGVKRCNNCSWTRSLVGILELERI